MLITYQAHLLEKKQISSDVYFFRFAYPPNEGWDFKAGQYMIMHIPQADGQPARRLYSIASAPHETNSLDFVIQIVPGGVAGPFLTALNEGDEITMQGPAGLFTFKDSPKDVVYLATGTGIAPMYSIIKHQLEVVKNPHNFYLFFGLKTCEDIYLFDELHQLAQTHTNLHLKLCLSRQDVATNPVPEKYTQYSLIGRVTHGVEKLWEEQPDLRSTETDYYVCGSKEVVESLRAYLEEKGIRKEDVHFEKFT